MIHNTLYNNFIVQIILMCTKQNHDTRLVKAN